MFTTQLTRGFILIPALLIMSIIALWTLHGLAQVHLGLTATGFAAATRSVDRELQARVRHAGAQIMNGQTVSDPEVEFSALGCIDWSGHWLRACPSETPYLFAYRISLSHPTSALERRIEAVLLTRIAAENALSAMPELSGAPAPNNSFENLDLFSDPVTLPSPGWLMLRQDSVL